MEVKGGRNRGKRPSSNVDMWSCKRTRSKAFHGSGARQPGKATNFLWPPWKKTKVTNCRSENANPRAKGGHYPPKGAPLKPTMDLCP